MAQVKFEYHVINILTFGVEFEKYKTEIYIWVCGVLSSENRIKSKLT